MSTKLSVKITFEEELLGTAAASPEVHREYIAAQAPDAASVEDEVAALGAAAVAEKSVTRFARDADGTPILWDYQVKGFFKDSCGLLARVPGSAASKLKAYRKVIDGLVFVRPRQIRLALPAGAALGRCERPLRAQTAQGERIALAASESAPAGTTAEFSVVLLDPRLESLIRELLDYGELRGLGQWRSSGKGRFLWAVA